MFSPLQEEETGIKLAAQRSLMLQQELAVNAIID